MRDYILLIAKYRVLFSVPWLRAGANTFDAWLALLSLTPLSTCPSLDILYLADDVNKNHNIKVRYAVLPPGPPLLRIYNIDGKKNSPVESLHIQTPIRDSFFYHDPRLFLSGGRSR